MSNYINTIFHAPLGKRKCYSFYRQTPPLCYASVHMYYYRTEGDKIEIYQYTILRLLFWYF